MKLMCAPGRHHHPHHQQLFRGGEAGTRDPLVWTPRRWLDLQLGARDKAVSHCDSKRGILLERAQVPARDELDGDAPVVAGIARVMRGKLRLGARGRKTMICRGSMQIFLAVSNARNVLKRNVLENDAPQRCNAVVTQWERSQHNIVA